MITTKDGKKIIEDGEHITFSALLMDSVQHSVAGRAVLINDAAIGHKPGGLMMTDAQKRPRHAAYQAYDAALTERWKTPTPNNHAEPINQANASLNTAGDPGAAVRIAAGNKLIAEQSKKPGAGAAAYAGYDKKLSERWRGTATA